MALNYFAIRSKNEDDENDNDEGVVWKFPEEEEEEVNRIKEESRKRMEAILAKYKKKPEQQNEPFLQDKGKGNNSSSYIAITMHNDLSMIVQMSCILSITVRLIHST